MDCYSEFVFSSLNRNGESHDYIDFIIEDGYRAGEVDCEMVVDSDMIEMDLFLGLSQNCLRIV